MLDYKKTIFNILTFVVISALILLAIFVSVYFWPFLIAVVVAFSLEKLINYVTSKAKISRKFIGTVMVVVLYIIVAAIVFLLVTALVKEAISLSVTLPEQYELVKLRYNDVFIKVKNFLATLPSSVSDSIYNFGLNLLSKIVELATNAVNGVINFVMVIPHTMIYVIVTFLATLFLTTERREIGQILTNVFPAKIVKKFSEVIKGCFTVLGQYLKAQIILITVTFVELFIAFVILQRPYPLTLALVIAVVDALPILGTGTVLIPWAIYSAITGELGLGVGLLVSYIVITIVRQLIEPRVVSSKLGVHPFVTLLVMYLGFKIFGLFGLIIGPVVMIIFKNVFYVMFETGFFKKMFVYTNEENTKSKSENKNISKK